MPIRVDAYTNTGMAGGWLLEAAHLREALERGQPLELNRATWQAMEDLAPTTLGTLALEPDDLIVVVGDDESIVPVHAVWHSVGLEAGVYRIEGELPTMPGFDPGRALTRPTGEFVLLARRPRRDQGPARRRGRDRPARVRQPLHRRAGRGRSHAGVLLPGRRGGHVAPAGTAGRRDAPNRARSGDVDGPGPGRPGSLSDAGRSRLTPGGGSACDGRDAARLPAGLTTRRSNAARCRAPARSHPRRSTGSPAAAGAGRRAEVSLVHRDERDGLTRGAGTAGAADPVDVVLRVPRELEVDDDRQVLDVEAARGDVGRDEHPDVARLEALERARPLGLRAVRVDGHGVQARPVEASREPGGGDLGPREHQHLAQVVRPQQVDRGAPPCGRGRPGRRAGGRPRRRCSAARPRSSPDRAGSWRTGARTSSSNVAENSRFWRWAGSSARILRMSGRKPMSSMRSASSSTRIETWLRFTVRCWTWSSSRPGVATRISTPACRILVCGSIGTPP